MWPEDKLTLDDLPWFRALPWSSSTGWQSGRGRWSCCPRGPRGGFRGRPWAPDSRSCRDRVRSRPMRPKEPRTGLRRERKRRPTTSSGKKNWFLSQTHEKILNVTRCQKNEASKKIPPLGEFSTDLSATSKPILSDLNPDDKYKWQRLQT